MNEEKKTDKPQENAHARNSARTPCYVRCPDCGKNVKMSLLIDETDLLDGWHGECCQGFMYKDLCRCCKGSGIGQDWDSEKNKWKPRSESVGGCKTCNGTGRELTSVERLVEKYT